MRLAADSGLWSTGPGTTATPLTAVLEVTGAVLSWTVDDPPEDASAQITFTDVSRADWLWRILGESGHVAVTSALASAADGTADGLQSIELTGVGVVPGSVHPLRRLAIGHWLRRWWPASRQDGIAGLDRALLDVEVALLTVGAQGFFTDDTLDSDVAELLAPHATALIAQVRSADQRIVDLVRAGVELADEAGIDDIGWPELHAALDDSSAILTVSGPSGRRDDYALAAGSDGGPRRGPSIARGVASINWSAVPPGIFDAAENTVEWSVELAGTTATAVVRAAVIGPDPATGVAVQLRAGAIGSTGTLDADGRATLRLVDTQRRRLTEQAVWDHDWPTASVIIGADVTEPRETRERVRRLARLRMDRPGDDAFLAEILASESSY